MKKLIEHALEVIIVCLRYVSLLLLLFYHYTSVATIDIQPLYPATFDGWHTLTLNIINIRLVYKRYNNEKQHISATTIIIRQTLKNIIGCSMLILLLFFPSIHIVCRISKTLAKEKKNIFITYHNNLLSLRDTIPPQLISIDTILYARCYF